MNNQEALNTLNDIRNMMEKSTRFVSFSGLSSIVIGIYACIAAIIAYSILGNTTPGTQTGCRHACETTTFDRLRFFTDYRLYRYGHPDVQAQSPPKQPISFIRFQYQKATVEFLPAFGCRRNTLYIIDLAKPLWPYFFDHADILWRRSDQCVELYVFQYPLSGLCGNRSRPGR